MYIHVQYIAHIAVEILQVVWLSKSFCYLLIGVSLVLPQICVYIVFSFHKWLFNWQFTNTYEVCFSLIVVYIFLFLFIHVCSANTFCINLPLMLVAVFYNWIMSSEMWLSFKNIQVNLKKKNKASDKQLIKLINSVVCVLLWLLFSSVRTPNIPPKKNTTLNTWKI